MLFILCKVLFRYEINSVMKKYFLFLIFLPLLSYSQKFSVSFLQPSPIAYIGIDNPITCTVEGLDCKNIIITTDNGIITKSSGNSYLYRPERQADTKFDIYKLVRKKKRKIGEYSFRIRNFSDPIAYVGGYNNNQSIQKNLLKVQQGVSATCIPGFAIDIRYQVLKFNISIFRNNAPIFNTYCIGNSFSPETISVLQLTQKGDIVLFHSIYVQTEENGEEKLVSPVQLVVIE